MAGEMSAGGGGASGAKADAPGRRRINISELASQEYLDRVEDTAAVATSEGARRTTRTATSTKAALRDSLVISSSVILVALIAFYRISPEWWGGYFEWTNLVSLVMVLGFAIIGMFMVMTSLGELPQYLTGKVKLVFLVAVITVALPVGARYIGLLGSMPIIFINLILAAGAVPVCEENSNGS